MNSHLFRSLSALVGLLLCAGLALAVQTVQHPVTFSAANQQAWLGDKTAGHGFGASWNESGGASDGFDSYILGYYGGGIDASCSGGMSLSYTATVRDARVNITYPITVTLNYPNNGVLYPGDTFTISTAYTNADGAKMEVSNPQARLAINARLHGGLSAGAWLELASQDIFDGNFFNLSFDTGTRSLFDSDWKDSWDKNLDNILIMHAQKPVINFNTARDGAKLTANGRGVIGTMNGNITNAACKLAGLPTPNKSGSYDIGVDVSYETKLASLEADMACYLGQDYTFTPTPTVTLTLSNGQTVSVPLGQTVTFTMPSVPAGTPTNDVVFTPTCTLPNSLANTTRFIIGSGLYFDPFTANFSMGIDHVGDVDLDFDPVGRYSLVSGELPITMYNGSTGLNGFTAQALSPFTLRGYVYPAPVISGIAPIMVKQGKGASRLTVVGDKFVPEHGINPSTKVLWDGQERPTTYNSRKIVYAALTAEDNNAEGIHQLSVLNPPPGGGPSVGTRPYIVDGTKPETSITLTGPRGLRGWFVGDVQVNLTATDNLAGVVWTAYTLDTNPCVVQRFPLPTTPPPFVGPFRTDTFTVTGDKIHMVRYYSRDNVLNSELVQKKNISIDTTLPQLTATVSPDSFWPPNNKMNPITVWGKMTDNLSGVDRASAYFHVVDEYGLVQPTARVLVNQDGTYRFTTQVNASRRGTDKDGRTYTVYVRVRDMAGWWNHTTATVTIGHDLGNHNGPGKK